jgi:hypothetical protein
MTRATSALTSNRPNMWWGLTWVDDSGKVWADYPQNGRTDASGALTSNSTNTVEPSRWVKATVKFADGTTCSTTFYSSDRNMCSGSMCTPPTTSQPNPF